MKKWVMEYLSVSRKERSGFIMLLIIVFSIWLLPRYFGRKPLDNSILKKADAALAAANRESVSVARPPRLFAFDPNTLNDDGWKELGLSDKNIRTIRNYLNKGGKFRAAEDIHRIYGIRADLAGQLEPYIRIHNKQMHTYKWRTAPQPRAAPRFDSRTMQHGQGSYRPAYKKYAERTYDMVDINTADTSMFIALPGIGSKLAARIILFREKCGGFHHIDQLAEVYGLKDSVFMRIKPMLEVKASNLRMLKINSIGIDSLALHPYITGSEARAIVKYRQQHGAFQRIDDLLAIAVITKAWIEKLTPYLDFN